MMAKVFVKKITSSLDTHIEEALTYLDWERIIPDGSKVFFKPNLTYPAPLYGVTTTPEFIEAVLRVFSSRSLQLIVGESDGGYRAWPAEITFKSHRLPEICKKYNAKLINLSREPSVKVDLVFSKGNTALNLPEILVKDIDALITLPVPKIHQVTFMSGAIKNQWGCIPDSMRLLKHPFFDEMILKINQLVHTKMALADGQYFLNKTGPMLGGDPVHMNLVMGSDSIGALDLAICKVMGIDLKRVRHLQTAKKYGWIPDESEILYNQQVEQFNRVKFYLQRTLRSRVVALAFDHNFAVNLLWNSKFADFLHKILYSLSGNKVKDVVQEQSKSV